MVQSVSQSWLVGEGDLSPLPVSHQSRFQGELRHSGAIGAVLSFCDVNFQRWADE